MSVRSSALMLVAGVGAAFCLVCPSGAGVVAPSRPGALAVAPDGGLLVADPGRQEILEWLPSGGFHIVAGTGRVGFSGDGGLAVDAAVDDPAGMAVASDGTVYFADQGNNRVRAISPAGRIATVAGDGRGGWVASGTRALAAGIGSPTDVAIGPHGRLYIASGNNEILRLNEDGTLTEIAGNKDHEGVVGIGRPARAASPDGPSGLAFDRTGDLFITGFNTKTLLMIDRSGWMEAPLGTTGFYPRGDGGIVTTADGEVLAMKTQAIVRLTLGGSKPIFSFGGRKIYGIRGFLPHGLAVSRSGIIYTDTDLGNGWASGTAIVAIGPRDKLALVWKP